MHAHSTIRSRFPNGHMMFRGDRRVDTHTHTHHPRPCGHTSRTSVDSHERALPSHRDEEHPGAPSPPEPTRTGAHQRRESPLARPLTNPPAGPVSPRTPDTTTMGAHIRRPCLWVIRCLPTFRRSPKNTTANDRSTNSLNRACQETDPGQRSLSRARSSAENRRNQDPSQGHRTWPSPRTGTPPSHTS